MEADTNFLGRTSKNAITVIVITMLCFFFTKERLSGQQCLPLTCNNDLQISLNLACELKLTPDVLLENPTELAFTIDLFDVDENFIRSDYLLPEDIGQTILYFISCGDNSCWGTINVSASIIPEIDVFCEPDSNGNIPPECILLFLGEDQSLPSEILSVDEVRSQFELCGPEILGSIDVSESRTGDICGSIGETIQLVYSAKIIQNGTISEVDIVTQTYQIQQIQIDTTHIFFPNDIVLDIDYLDNINVSEEDSIVFESGSPASILASEQEAISAYPFFINTSDSILDIQSFIDSTQVVVDSIVRDTMVFIEVDGVDRLVQKTIVDYIFETVTFERFDTVGKTNPIVPIVDQVGNAISSFSDIGIIPCGQGTHILREWTVVDWCDRNVSISAFQRIAIIDIEEFISFNVFNFITIMDTVQVEAIVFDTVFVDSLGFNVFLEDTILVDSIIFTDIVDPNFEFDFSVYDNNLFVFFVLEGSEDLVRFPQDITLDCNYLDEIDQANVFEELIFGSPESIDLFTEDFETAFPFYIDTFFTVPDIVKVVDTNTVVVDFILRDTLIREVIDNQEVWTVLTLVDEIFGEEITCSTDTVGTKFFSQSFEGFECNVITNFSDVIIPGCGNNMSIQRTWQLIDWFNTSVILSATQTIDIIDQTPPKIFREVNGEEREIANLDDVTVSVDPWSCRASLALPSLNIIDNCDPNAMVEWQSSDATIEDGFITNLLLSQNVNLITGVVTDACDNTTTIDFNVIVVDSIRPVAICLSSIQVSLTDNAAGIGEAEIPASSLDEGSHDSACGKVTITALRLEDWTDRVRDCRDIVRGFAPRSCNPFTQEVDLLDNADAEDCRFQGATTAAITKPSEFVRFCCEDFNQIVEVIVFIEDEFGNIGQCIVEVEVLEESTPSILCEDLVINCSSDNFSEPTLQGILCPIENSFEIELLSETAFTGSRCSGTPITREWFIDLDNSGNLSSGDPNCIQEVIVLSNNVFDPTSILWPRHVDGTTQTGIRLESFFQDIEETAETLELSMREPLNCSFNNNDQPPIWCDTDCGLIGLSVELDTIFQAGGNCMEINRSWTIIDWCLFDFENNGVNESMDSIIPVLIEADDYCTEIPIESQDSIYFKNVEPEIDGFYTFTQTILIQDTIPPTIAALETAIIFLDEESFFIQGDSTNCTGVGTIYASATDLCGLRLRKDIPLFWEITITDQDGEILRQRETIGSSASIPSLRGRQGDQQFVTWRVSDDCGNVTVAETRVSFNDFRKPEPVCISSLTFNFFTGQLVTTIFAEDYNIGSFDNCTEQDLLRFTVVEAREEPIRPGESGFAAQKSIDIIIDDNQIFEQLDVYVWDGSGNGDFCRVSLALLDEEIDKDEEDNNEFNDEFNDTQDDGLNTSASMVIAGQIQTSSGVNVDQAEVTIASSALSEYPLVTQTDNQGAFVFLNNPANFDFSLTASKRNDESNDISTLDLVIISRHILATESMSDPYDIIAADVSGDNTISASDIIELRRFILGQTDGFSVNKYWRFIDSNQLFFDENNPWPFNESINIRDNTENLLEENFIGVKLGDVNDSFGSQDSRSNDYVYFDVDDEILDKNEQYRIDIKSAESIHLNGFQFNVAHDGLDIIDLVSGEIEMVSDNWHTDENQTSVLWYNATSKSIKSGERLFSILVNSRSEGKKVSNLLHLQNQQLTAEAYIGDYDETHQVLFKFQNNKQAIELFQNEPNPFVDETSVSFRIAKAGIIKFNIYNSLGEELYELNKHFDSGKHTLLLNDIVKNQPGLMYYSLRQGNLRKVAKMLQINAVN